MNILEARRRVLGGEVIKRTAEGNPISVRSLARRYPGITMQGWTEQAQYEGKNLFDFSKFTATGTAGGSLDFENKTVTINANRNNWYPGATFAELCPDIEIGKTYTINADTTNPDSLKQVYFDNAIVYWLFGESLTITEEILNSHIAFYNNGLSSKENIVSQIMVNEGSTALPYEPYTGGAPSPSPDYPQEIISAGKWNEETQKWEYEIEVGGANLWDKEKASDLNNWRASVTQPGYSDFEIDVEPGQNITLSFPEKPPLGLGCYVGIVLEKDGKMMGWIYHSTNESLIHKAITTKSIGSKIWIRSHAQSISKFISQNPQFQIEYGDKRTEFMSYLKRSVTLTSDRPLTKWDRLEKRGGQWGWVYKSAGIMLDGSGDENWTTYSGYSGFQSLGVLPFIDVRREGFSEDIIVKTGTSDLGLKFEIWLGVDNSNIYVVRVPQFDAELPDNGLQNWRDWLSENPITILTYLDEETFVPLSTSEQEQMNELYTFRPTTVLSNDAGCEMSLTYKMKKSLQSVPQGMGIKKASGVTSCFTFGVKWNQVNKIVFKISGVKEKNNMLLCANGMSTPYIAVSDEYLHPSLIYFSASISAEEVLDGTYHEIVFTFDTPLVNGPIVNIWDSAWSKTIIYHEIAFYNGDDLLADYVPYYKGAGYMLDKKNNVVIRATNPEDYQFA